MTAPDTVRALLAHLRAAGVGMALNEAGDGLKLTGKGRQPAALLEAVKARRAEVLAHLRDEDTAKAEAADSGPALSPSPDFSEVETVGGEVVASGHDLPPPWEALPEDLGNLREAGPEMPDSDTVQARPGARPLPDWDTLAAQPGHCGSCARATDAPDWGALMVTCGCPPSAFEAGVKPLALHIGHRCAAYVEDGEAVGRGYRSKATGQTGQRPAPRWAVAP